MTCAYYEWFTSNQQRSTEGTVLSQRLLSLSYDIDDRPSFLAVLTLRLGSARLSGFQR